jgi:adenylate kinase
VRILILGPQGSGKGTQATRIASAYGIPHIATGEILRSAIVEGTDLGRRVEPILNAGDLVPDQLMVDLIRERLQGEDGFVLGKPLDIVLLLHVGDEVATQRLLGRAAAEGRKDDEPEAIANRLRRYHEETEPVVERYRTGGLLVPIPGERGVGEVAADIDAALSHVAVRSR